MTGCCAALLYTRGRPLPGPPQHGTPQPHCSLRAQAWHWRRRQQRHTTRASGPAAGDLLKNPQQAVTKWLQDSSSEAKPKINPDSPVHSESIRKTEGIHQHSPIRPPDWLASSPGMMVAFNVARAVLLAVLAITFIRWVAHRAKQAVSLVCAWGLQLHTLSMCGVSSLLFALPV